MTTTDSAIICPGCEQPIAVSLDDEGWISECGGEGEGGCEAQIAGIYADVHEQAIFEAMYASLREEPIARPSSEDLAHEVAMETLEDLFTLLDPQHYKDVITLSRKLWKDSEGDVSTAEAIATTLNWWFN